MAAPRAPRQEVDDDGFLYPHLHDRLYVERKSEMTYLVGNTMSNGSLEDIDVAAWPEEFLEEILQRMPRKNGIVYVDCNKGESKRDRIRCNIKYRPEDTRVGVPRELEHYMKTSLTRQKGQTAWVLLEDRVDARYRRDRDGVAYFCSLAPQKITTMTKQNRKKFDKAVQQLYMEDDLLSRAIKAPGPSDPHGRLVPKEVENGIVEEEKMAAAGRLDSPVAVLCEHSEFFVPSEYNVRCFSSVIADMFDHIAAVGALLIIYIGSDSSRDYVHECGRIFDMMASEHMVCIVCPQFSGIHDVLNVDDCFRRDGYGDITLYTNVAQISEAIYQWALPPRGLAPHIHSDIFEHHFWKHLHGILSSLHLDSIMAHAFPAEAAEEMRVEAARGPLDDPGDEDAPILGADLEREDAEKDMLDGLPLPGCPKSEAERRAAWLKLPQRTRIAIRKMHRQFGHAAPTVLTQLLRAARASKEFVEASQLYRCDACVENKPKPQTTKVSLPDDFVFGKHIGIDVLEIKDHSKERYLCLNIVDMGTSFQQLIVLGKGQGTPSSKECLAAFCDRWVTWAGWPSTVSTDRGLHNRGVFARTFQQHGCVVRQAGVESPEQIGKVERHGGLIKGILKRMITDQRVNGTADAELAVAEAIQVRNSMLRNHGFSPSQWVFGTLPRGPGDQMDEQEHADLGVLQGQLDGPSHFARRTALRAAARRAFVKEDCGRRVARAVLRKAAPLIGDYSPGDLACYRREDEGWSTACRLIGIDNKAAWLLHGGVPVCAGLDRLRRATSAETLAMQYLQDAR
jgi:hypothetical protein